jgi:hypothetical protein
MAQDKKSVYQNSSINRGDMGAWLCRIEGSLVSVWMGLLWEESCEQGQIWLC